MSTLDSASFAQLVQALITCCLLVGTLLARRTNRWLLVLLERERQEFESRLAQQRENEMRRHNATLRTLSESYAREERSTLESLLANERADFSLESSHPPSDSPPPEWLKRKTPPPSKSGGRPRARADWSDDEERTSLLKPDSEPPPGDEP